MSALIQALFATSFVCASMVSSTTALACGAPPDYSARVDGTDVDVSTFAIDCTAPSASTMLRQNVSTGEVVKLAAACDHGHWTDRCVPAGTYRYGLETPIAIADADCVCGPYAYFIEVAVTNDPSGCTSNDSPAEAVPWKNERLICRAPPTCGGAVPGGSPASCAPATDESGGCSTGGGSPIGLASFCIVIAAAWLRRRRAS